MPPVRTSALVFTSTGMYSPWSLISCTYRDEWVELGTGNVLYGGSTLLCRGTGFLPSLLTDQHFDVERLMGNVTLIIPTSGLESPSDLLNILSLFMLIKECTHILHVYCIYVCLDNNHIRLK